MSLEHLIVPRSQEVLKKQKDGGVSKGHRDQPERAPDGRSWDKLSNKIHNAVLDYNPKCKINIHEFILIND